MLCTKKNPGFFNKPIFDPTQDLAESGDRQTRFLELLETVNEIGSRQAILKHEIRDQNDLIKQLDAEVLKRAALTSKNSEKLLEIAFKENILEAAIKKLKGRMIASNRSKVTSKHSSTVSSTSLGDIAGATRLISEGESEYFSFAVSDKGAKSAFGEPKLVDVRKKVGGWLNHKDVQNAVIPYKYTHLLCKLPTSREMGSSMSIKSSKMSKTKKERRKETSRPPNEKIMCLKRTCSEAETDEQTRKSKRIKSQSTKEKFAVCFTRSKNKKEMEKTVLTLGGCVQSVVEKATVVVAKEVVRTINMLAAIGRGVPIVGQKWLEKSEEAGHFLDPWEYLLQDDKAETLHSFKLKDSLEKALKQPLLSGYSLYVTKSVLPPPDDMKRIIRSCGGNVISRMPKRWPPNSLIISCEEDRSVVKKIKRRPTVVTAEWILSGSLKQRLETDQLELPI